MELRSPHPLGAFLETVCAQWDGEVRDGLMRAAFLARLTRGSVLEMTQRPRVVEVLDKLAEDREVVYRDQTSPGAWRLEPRFRAYLQALACNALRPHELSDVLWRATVLTERELEVFRRATAGGAAAERASPRIQIRALGTFLILRDGSPLGKGRKAPGNPLALLKALVALGATGIPSHALADLLWPEAEGDSAFARLATTLHRARTLLGVREAILNGNGQLSLNRKLVSCDVLEFHDALQRIEAHRGGAREIGSVLLEAYPGPLLPACSEAWVQPCRERLAAKFAGAVARIGRRLHDESNTAEAQALYLQALAREPNAVGLRRLL